MIDRELFLRYRLFAVRVGLALSWVGLYGFMRLANRDDGSMAPGASEEVVILASMAILLTIAPWRKALLGEMGDAYIGVWTIMGVVGLIAAHDMRGEDPLPMMFILVIVFAAASLVRPGYLIVIAAAALSGYSISLDRAGTDFSSSGQRFEIALFALAALFAIAASFGVSRVFHTAARRLTELIGQSEQLERRREQLDELYDISATIGMGGTLAEIVPQLLRRVVESVGARVGLVFLFRGDHDDLELISPLWVSGRTVRAEGYRLSLTDAGVVQRVFTTGRPLLSNEPVSSADGDPLLGDLDTSRLAAVTMAVDARPVGVLVVADKEAGDFDEEDIVRLQSLAGPAALVMNQMDRFDAAQELGQNMAELAQLKSDFVSVVSHELRSPLTTIIGSLRTLLRPGIAIDAETTNDLIETAARQADRLRELIEDLMVASRLDSDALPVRPEPTEVSSLIDDLLIELPSAAGRVTVRVDADLPEVEVDPAHLGRILRNLVENALKYAADAPIEVTASLAGEQVWLSVVDHGDGIPYELHDHIFQRFTQAQHHETRAMGGAGLGLSIVRGLTETMGGRVWFEPTVGGGATFTVALPHRSRSRIAEA